MIALFLSPVYVLIHAYILIWILRWLGACHNGLSRKWVKAAVILVYAFLPRLCWWAFS